MSHLAGMMPYWCFFLIALGLVVVYFLKLRYFNIYQKIVYFTFGSSFVFIGLAKLGQKLLWPKMWSDIFIICTVVILLVSGIMAKVFSNLMKKK